MPHLRLSGSPYLLVSTPYFSITRVLGRVARGGHVRALSKQLIDALAILPVVHRMFYVVRMFAEIQIRVYSTRVKAVTTDENMTCEWNFQKQRYASSQAKASHG